MAEGARFLWQVPHVQENPGPSAQTYGLILAAGAVGGIAGSLAAEAVIRRLGPGRRARSRAARRGHCRSGPRRRGRSR